MRFLITAIVVTYVLTSGCIVSQFSSGKRGSGVSATQTREVEAFNSVSLVGSGSADITIGSPQSVTVTFDDNLIEDVKTTVNNGKLTVRVDENYSTSIGLNIKIVTESLDGINVSGAGKVTARDLDAEDFATDISGVGKIELSGKASTLKVQISGAGKLDATDLETLTSGISISGVGKAIVNSSQAVNAKISGAGKVDIFGNPPQVDKQISGVGSVNVR